MERDQHNRKSIRLREYDYTSAGAYFVTICVRGRECALGEIVDGEMVLNACGGIVEEAWQWLGQQYPYVTLDAWVVMPNHIHAIIMVEDPDVDDCRGAVPAPVNAETQGRGTRPLRREDGEVTFDGVATLGQIVGYYKYQTTKHINTHLGTPGAPFWQRNYYEHVIRNEGELAKVREYIDDNPLKWEIDRENPALEHFRLIAEDLGDA